LALERAPVLLVALDLAVSTRAAPVATHVRRVERARGGSEGGRELARPTHSAILLENQARPLRIATREGARAACARAANIGANRRRRRS
jgi:hypothetical protein